METLKLIVPQQQNPARQLIGFRNVVLDTRTGLFSLHDKKHWLRTLCEVDYTQPVDGEALATHAPAFWRWLTAMTGSYFWRSLTLVEAERVFWLK